MLYNHRFHTEAHVSKMFNAFEKVEKGKGKNKGVHHIDEDTTVMRATPEACFRSAGSAVHAVDCLLGENPVAKSCFVAVRPPGHHAEVHIFVIYLKVYKKTLSWSVFWPLFCVCMY